MTRELRRLCVQARHARATASLPRPASAEIDRRWLEALDAAGVGDWPATQELLREALVLAVAVDLGDEEQLALEWAIAASPTETVRDLPACCIESAGAELGEALYCAYARSGATPGANTREFLLPAWESLAPDERHKWQAVADYALDWALEHLGGCPTCGEAVLPGRPCRHEYRGAAERLSQPALAEGGGTEEPTHPEAGHVADAACPASAAV